MNKRTVLMLSALSLAGCNSDGDQGLPSLGATSTTPVDLNPGGIWYGTYTTNDSTTRNAIILVDENNEAIWFFTDAITAGSCDMAVDINDFVCQIDSLDITITGTIDQRDTLSGSIGGSETATFTATYSDVYEENSSLNLIDSIWLGSDGAFNKTYTIDSDGNSTGSDSDGCIYAGSIELINSSYNMYNYTETISNCGAFNGLYSGKGFISDTTVEDDTFNVIVVNDTAFISSILTRQ